MRELSFKKAPSTDFGSEVAHSGGLESGGLESLGPPISDLEWHMPVLKKRYKGPFNLRLLFRESFNLGIA